MAEVYNLHNLTDMRQLLKILFPLNQRSQFQWKWLEEQCNLFGVLTGLTSDGNLLCIFYATENIPKGR